MSQIPVWLEVLSIVTSFGVLAALVGAVGGVALFKYQTWKEKRINADRQL